MTNILCFGDSNTWGYDPETKGRFPWGVRWTSILQERLGRDNYNILEEGLCGRTTVFEDETRPGRKGIETIREIFDSRLPIDQVIVMLGTNDCKKYNNTTSKEIASGVESCLDIILSHVNPIKVLLISPILLGEDVWKKEFDPEFSKNSVAVSKELKKAYSKIAEKRGVNFMAASDFCLPSKIDQEHLNQSDHRILADAIYDKLVEIRTKCA
ncbi:MAG: GDSL-type esterase/lipase family protein [Lachnospira sp.]